MIDIELLKKENEIRVREAMFANDIERLLGGDIRPTIGIHREPKTKFQSLYLWDIGEIDKLSLDSLRKALGILTPEGTIPVSIDNGEKKDLPYYIHISTYRTFSELHISWVYKGHIVQCTTSLPTGDTEVDSLFTESMRTLEDTELLMKKAQCGRRWRNHMATEPYITFSCPCKRYNGGASTITEEGHIAEMMDILLKQKD